ncbi:MAG TPA: hypothetical protein VGC79_28255 [Polyangiaceae bacterium]
MVAAVTLVALLTTLEVLARSQGAEPSLKDGPPAWSVQRQRARGKRGGSAPLALIGSSRFQLGIEPDILANAIARPVANLAISASLPFAVLEDLANDNEFEGWVLCDVGAFRRDDDDPTSAAISLSQSYINYFHARTSVSDLEIGAREFFQERLAFLQPPFSPHTRLMRLGIPTGFGQKILSNRFSPYDFSRSPDIEAVRQHWERTFRESLVPVSDEQVLRFAEKISVWVRGIQARGGNVIFLRMVSSFGVRVVEDSVSPRAQWDLFASHVAGIAIHYEDVPSLRDFKAMDGSHLDAKDARVFSGALGRVLVERDAFRAVPR